MVEDYVGFNSLYLFDLQLTLDYESKSKIGSGTF